MISLQNLFRKNLPAKIFALIGAFIMWGYVMNEQNPYVTMNITVPVQGINVPESARVTYGITEVTMKIKAPRSSFATLNKSEFVAYVDLAELSGNEGTLKLKTTLQNGFEVVEVSAEEVSVSLEKLTARGVPVHLALVGNSAPGTAVASIKPANNYVNVHGTEKEVERVERVVANVQLTGMNASFKANARLVAVDKAGKTVDNVKIMPEILDVDVELINGSDKRSIPVKVNISGEPAPGYSVTMVTSEPAQVELIGKEAQLAELSGIETEPISVDGLSGDAARSASIVIPSGFASQSKNVEVKILIQKQDNKK